MSQSQFGALAGVKKNAQINYEADRRSPDGDYLMAITKHGVDVLYVLTGMRAPGVISEVRRKFGAVLEMGEIGEHLERLMRDEPGGPRDRDDWDRWLRALDAVRRGLAGAPPMSTQRRAALILAAYDLLAQDDEASRNRVIDLVNATGEDQ